jgi:hypothetical protein
MNDLPVAKVELSGSRVVLTPVQPNPSYDFIYRAALGVEWNQKAGSFFSPSTYMLDSRKDCGALENVSQLVVALIDEMGLCPTMTTETVWVGFDEPLKLKIRELIAGEMENWAAREATRSERAADFAKSERLRTMRSMAETAWKRKDYAGVARLYSAEALHLTPLEKKRLTYAQGYSGK